METNDLPNNSSDPSEADSSERTLSTGSTGQPTSQIGPYRLLQLLGEGGMGEVWLAEQSTPIRRTVAVKLIKAGMDTKAVVARFESERQALALMEHANIARVFDAGSTAEGRPYFVMEYVPGLPITEYCDKHWLTVKERLDLIQVVCDGVQHAHQKAIIHRDLKPSNVLVVEHDNKALPKIIDFGLAKAMAQRLTEQTMFTELGAMIGTPEYMSPEQADQREQSIDTRTDVYSLGVILYQLVVGALPFETKGLRDKGLEALLRVIREQEPPKPSAKIRSMGEASNKSAEKRREEPRSFARHVSGELDWIIMKALERDRTRRYGSPTELCTDIQRYLRNEPVLAHPPSVGYRAGKYIRRHRWGVALAAAGVVLLVAFGIYQSIQVRRITRERDRADRISAFMTKMFQVSKPSEARGNAVTAREILDKASKDIDTGLANDPELQAKMMYTMGNTYFGLGLYAEARSLFQRALEIQRNTLGLGNSATLHTMNDLAAVFEVEGRLAEAEGLDREVLKIRRRELGSDHPDTVTSLVGLAVDVENQGRYAEAEKLNREALDIQHRVQGPNHWLTLLAASNLADVLTLERKYDEAEKLYRETLDSQRQVRGPDHPDTLSSMRGLANTLRAESRYVEAEKLFGETIEIHRRVLGSDHPDTLWSMERLARTLMEDGHYVEAENLFRETLEIRRRSAGAQNPDTLDTIEYLALDLSHEGHYADAAKLFREAVQIAVQAKQQEDLADVWYEFGCGAAIAGRKEDALKYLEQAMDLGYGPAESVTADPDLKSLHGDSRFEALVAKSQKSALGPKSN
jgi:eukaryotic-like serine/threonine-protein kinase